MWTSFQNWMWFIESDPRGALLRYALLAFAIYGGLDLTRRVLKRVGAVLRSFRGRPASGKSYL